MHQTRIDEQLTKSARLNMTSSETTSELQYQRPQNLTSTAKTKIIPRLRCRIRSTMVLILMAYSLGGQSWYVYNGILTS